MTKVCVRCGGEVSASAKFCTSCGSELSQTTGSQFAGLAAGAAAGGGGVTAPPAAAVDTATWHCAECGSEHESATHFCADCGTPRERARRFTRDDATPAIDTPRLTQASDALAHSSPAPGTGTDPLGAETRPAAGPPCPNCGAAKLPGSSFCTSCGAALGSRANAGVMTAAPNGATRPAAVTCPSCGAGFDSPRMFCTGCGTRLGASAAPPVPPAPLPEAFQPTRDDHVYPQSPQMVLRSPTPVAAPPAPVAPAVPARGASVPAWVAVIVTALIFAGGGVAAALVFSGKHHAAPAVAHVHKKVIAPPPSGHTQVQGPGTTTPPGQGGQPAPPGPSDQQAVLDTVNGHWEAIKNHEFAKAYGFLDPSVAGPESDWISSHESDGITNVTHNFTVADVSGTSATVNVDQLQTMARSDVSSTNPSGCMNWTGTYGLTKESGTWLITSPNLSQNPC